MHTDHPTVVDRTSFRRAGAWILAAAILWWVAAAALIPADDYFLGETARDEALSIAEHAGLFRAFHLVALLGVAAGAAGVVLITRSFRDDRPGLLRIATAVAGIGLAGWTAEVVVRLTATVARARDVAAGTEAATGEPAIGQWGLFAVAALGFVAPVLCAWALAGRRLPSRRASMVVAVLVTLSTLAGLATLAPSMVYQFGALALGLQLVLSRRAGTEAASQVPADARLSG